MEQAEKALRDKVCLYSNKISSIKKRSKPEETNKENIFNNDLCKYQTGDIENKKLIEKKIINPEIKNTLYEFVDDTNNSTIEEMDLYQTAFNKHFLYIMSKNLKAMKNRDNCHEI